MGKTSMTLGWLVGRQIAGQRSKQKTIVGYSYNGTVLPALPDWDKETYPYAAIVFNSNTGVYALYVSTVQIAKDALAYVSTYTLTDPNVWSLADEHYATSFWYLDKFFWSDHDILNSDGSVYLAASDPIPVYE